MSMWKYEGFIEMMKFESKMKTSSKKRDKLRLEKLCFDLKVRRRQIVAEETCWTLHSAPEVLPLTGSTLLQTKKYFGHRLNKNVKHSLPPSPEAWWTEWKKYFFYIVLKQLVHQHDGFWTFWGVVISLAKPQKLLKFWNIFKAKMSKNV